MKHKFGLFGSAILGVALLASCGASSPSVDLSTKHGKVTYAFNGVDQALRNQKAKKNNRLSPLQAIRETEGVTEMYSQFDEQRQVDEPDLGYNEPPLVQFQFLKQLYDATGESYLLGTTYGATITGETHYDFATGIAGSLHQSYTADILIYIDIDESNFISCKFGLHSHFTSDAGETHSQFFYAELGLAYDLDKTDANFTLAMRTVDDCSSFASEEAICTYEYDYVSVKESAIEEWRKDYVCTDRKVTLTESHPNAASYIAEGMEFAGGARAYKNGTMYKTTRTGKRSQDESDVAKRIAQGTTVIDKLGGNSTDIKHEDFFKVAKTDNPKVVDIYNGFSRTYGVDIVGSLCTCQAHIYDHEEEEIRTPKFLQIIGSSEWEIVGEYTALYLSTSNATFGDLLSAGSYRQESDAIPVFRLLDEEEYFIRNATKEDVQIVVEVGGREIKIQNEDNVVAFARENKLGKLVLDLSLIVDGAAVDTKKISVICGEFTNILPDWPSKELEDMGLSAIPCPSSFPFNAAVTGLDRYDQAVEIQLMNLTEQDYLNYEKTLKANNFVSEGKENAYLFAARTDVVYRLELRYSNMGSNSSLRVEYAGQEYRTSYSWDRNLFQELNQDVLIPEGNIFYHPQDRADVFTYPGLSQKTINAFIQRLTDNGWTHSEQSTSGSDIFYFDHNGARFYIGLNYGQYSVDVVYSATDIPPEEAEYTHAFLSVNGFEEIPMEGGDKPNTFQHQHYFEQGSMFVVYLGENRQVVLGYESLYINETAENCLRQGKDRQSILVTVSAALSIQVQRINQVYRIVCSLEGGEDPEPHATLSLVGQFNSWDAASGVDLVYGGNGYYSLTGVSFKKGQGFVLVVDHSWNTYYGYPYLDHAYDCLTEGETYGIIPATNFTANLVFDNGKISLTDIVTEQGGSTPIASFEHVALVGSFNSWDETSTAHEFQKAEDGSYSVDIDLATGDEFKICFDYSWNGCMGYDEIKDFGRYPDLFSREQKDGNVHVLRPLHLTLGLTVQDSGLVFTITVTAE